MISLLMRRGQQILAGPLAIICGGDFFYYDSIAVNCIAGVDKNGRLANTFTSNLFFSPIATYVASIAVQSNGKFVCGGRFDNYGGSNSKGIARLNSNGTLDTSFTVGTGFNNVVSSVVIRSDGRIICGGIFGSYNGISCANIAQLNSDGTLDPGFVVGTGFNSSVVVVVVRSYDPIIDNGTYIVGGLFTTYKGATANRIAFLSSTGNLDSSFNVGTGFNNAVRSLSIQSDGKVVCGGQFTSFNNTTRNRLVRLNANGTLDTGFNIGTGFNNTVSNTLIQSDGKLICVGSFTSFNGTAINRIARLNSDGTLDTSFTVGSGFNSTVQAIVAQSDNKFVCSGFFTSYAGVSCLGLARLNTDGTLDTSFTSYCDGSLIRCLATVS